MHTDILTTTQLAVLDGLKPIPAVHEFYLAGRTALALRHGHRRSVDFDFFRATSFDAQELMLTLDRAFRNVERLPTGEQTVGTRRTSPRTASRSRAAGSSRGSSD